MRDSPDNRHFLISQIPEQFSAAQLEHLEGRGLRGMSLLKRYRIPKKHHWKNDNFRGLPGSTNWPPILCSGFNDDISKLNTIWCNSSQIRAIIAHVSWMWLLIWKSRSRYILLARSGELGRFSGNHLNLAKQYWRNAEVSEFSNEEDLHGAWQSAWKEQRADDTIGFNVVLLPMSCGGSAGKEEGESRWWVLLVSEKLTQCCKLTQRCLSKIFTYLVTAAIVSKPLPSSSPMMEIILYIVTTFKSKFMPVVLSERKSIALLKKAAKVEKDSSLYRWTDSISAIIKK